MNKVSPVSEPVGTHNCMRVGHQCNTHSSHLRCPCTGCTDPVVPCDTCIATPPYGPPCSCKLTWVQCRNGSPHKRQICTIAGCQEKPPTCDTCDVPCREVYVMERELGMPGVLRKVAHGIGSLVGGSAMHWAVVVTGKTPNRPRMSQFELAKSMFTSRASLKPAILISPNNPVSFTDMKNMGGVTYLVDDEIQAIAASIVEVSPSYKLRTASCQTFAVDLALRIVETPSQALLDMKTEQTRLRMEKGEWDENILNHCAGEHSRLADRKRKDNARVELSETLDYVKKQEAERLARELESSSDSDE